MGKRQLAQPGVTGRGDGQPDECLVYDLLQAGRMLGLARGATYRAAANGDLPTVRIGKLLKVPKAALHQMLEPASAKAS
jgi:excisionase family DNA binding protein